MTHRILIEFDTSTRALKVDGEWPDKVTAAGMLEFAKHTILTAPNRSPITPSADPLLLATPSNGRHGG